MPIGGGLGIRGFVTVNNVANQTYAASAYINPDYVGGVPVYLEPGLPTNVVVSRDDRAIDSPACPAAPDARRESYARLSPTPPQCAVASPCSCCWLRARRTGAGPAREPRSDRRGAADARDRDRGRRHARAARAGARRIRRRSDLGAGAGHRRLPPVRPEGGRRRDLSHRGEGRVRRPLPLRVRADVRSAPRQHHRAAQPPRPEDAVGLDQDPRRLVPRQAHRLRVRGEPARREARHLHVQRRR